MHDRAANPPETDVGARQRERHLRLSGLKRHQKLDILAENDQANERAREACGSRWHDADRKVFIIRPTRGNDLNDTLRAMWHSRRSLPGNLLGSARRRAASKGPAAGDDRGLIRLTKPMAAASRKRRQDFFGPSGKRRRQNG